MNGRFFGSKRNLLILILVSICLLMLSFLSPAAGQDKNKKLLSWKTSFEPDGTLTFFPIRTMVSFVLIPDQGIDMLHLLIYLKKQSFASLPLPALW